MQIDFDDARGVPVMYCPNCGDVFEVDSGFEFSVCRVCGELLEDDSEVAE